MGLVQNLKKTLSDWGDKILVELSSAYIKQLAKQTLKKQDNSSSTESLQNPLTQEDPAYYNSNILSRYFRKDYYDGD